MGCRSLSLVLTPVIVLGGWDCSLAQNLLIGSPPCCKVTNVNYGSVPRWTEKEWPTKNRIVVETVQPAIPNAPGLSTTNRIPEFGGSLQYFANRVDTTTASGIRMPFGGNLVLPLARGRVEIFGGIGGVYFEPAIYLRPGTAYVRPHVPYVQPNSWLTQTSAGARAALDPEHHFWLGASNHYLINFADKTRRWSSSTADFTIRFGR